MNIKRAVLTLSAFTLLILLINAAVSEVKFAYMGAEVCRECHGEDAIGNQYGVWASSPHAKAYLILSGEKAASIASAAGIDNPQKSGRCLKCHTTGKGAVRKTLEEGVGCEACHGPGSGYYRASVHVDYSNRENGYRRAVKAGMYNILGPERLRMRERLCLSCHKKERSCYPSDNGEIVRQKMTIQSVDSLCRGKVNFRHPLRR